MPPADTLPRPDLSAADALLQGHIAAGRLPGASYWIEVGGRPVAEAHLGLADRESGRPMAPDTLVRAFSNTKLFTSVAALRLVDAGRLDLDEPVAERLPALRGQRVLAPGARTLDDTVPLAVPVTLRHLLAHTAGLAQGIFDAGTLLQQAYMAAGARSPETTLAELTATLGALPLNFQPGSDWLYSAATDLVARLVELASGQPFAEHLAEAVCAPLGIVDTAHVLRPAQVPRLAALYGVPEGTEALDAEAPASRRLEHVPYRDAFLRPFPRQSGAGGLVTSGPDMMALVRALMPAGPGRPAGGLLREATLAELFRDQLPPGVDVHFRHTGRLPALGFGLGGAVTRRASPITPPGTEGALQWGGLAGTHWWIAPNAAGGRGVVGVLHTQRMMGFWQPFWWDFQRAVHAALEQAASGPPAAA